MTTENSRKPITGEDEAEAVSQENTALHVKEVAEHLGVHPNTVRAWADSGVLRSYRIGPRRDRCVPVDAVRQMLASGSE